MLAPIKSSPRICRGLDVPSVTQQVDARHLDTATLKATEDVPAVVGIVVNYVLKDGDPAEFAS